MTRGRQIWFQKDDKSVLVTQSQNTRLIYLYCYTFVNTCYICIINKNILGDCQLCVHLGIRKNNVIRTKYNSFFYLNKLTPSEREFLENN